MKTELIVFLTALVWFCDGLCPSNWKQMGNHCYLLYHQKANWTSANKICNYHSAKLATPEEESRHIFVKALLLMEKQHESVWIGASDEVSEGRWVWVGTDHVLGYSKWHPGEPNNRNTENCMTMTTTKFEWQDNPCDQLHAFVCEGDAWSRC